MPFAVLFDISYWSMKAFLTYTFKRIIKRYNINLFSLTSTFGAERCFLETHSKAKAIKQAIDLFIIF
ncbi:hypothetical protein XENTR_v10007973 [Xenopus tropicalis]|nr:hypothetical protein XENTR_v10007973 [Xenopus tropicalis]